MEKQHLNLGWIYHWALFPLTGTPGNPISSQCNDTLSPSWFLFVPSMWEIWALQIRKTKYRNELFVQGHRAGSGRNRNRSCDCQITPPILSDKPTSLHPPASFTEFRQLRGELKVQCPFFFFSCSEFKEDNFI